MDSSDTSSSPQRASNTSTIPKSAAGSKKSARRPRWGRRLAIASGLLVLLVWAAPMIVAHSPLLNRFANMALEPGQGSIAVGGASLGWFSPVVVRNVEVTGPDGKRLAEVYRAGEVVAREDTPDGVALTVRMDEWKAKRFQAQEDRKSVV